MTIAAWPLKKEDKALSTPVFEVCRQTCLSPKDGRDKEFTVLKARDWAQVLAVTPEGRALLVRQFRQGSRTLSLELPGGVIEEGQSPLEAARRELMEETGYSAAAWRQLAAFRPNPAIQNNTAYLFLAEGAELTGATDFDENEDLELLTVPLPELKDMVLKGSIDHVIMAAGILFYFAEKEAV